MRARVVSLIALATAGCGRLGFDVGFAADGPRGDGGGDGGSGGPNDGERLDAGGDGASPDAPPDARIIPAIAASGCVPTTAAGSTFPGTGAPCSDWGGAVTSSLATVSEASGQLTIAPGTTDQGYGQCVRVVDVDAPGVFAEVSAVLTVPTGFTTLKLGTAYIQVHRSNQTGLTAIDFHDLQTLAEITYDPVLMRWWRIRPITGGTVFETSPDAAAWTVQATSSHERALMEPVTLYAAVGAAEPTPGAASFATIDLCP